MIDYLKQHWVPTLGVPGAVVGLCIYIFSGVTSTVAANEKAIDSIGQTIHKIDKANEKRMTRQETMLEALLSKAGIPIPSIESDSVVVETVYVPVVVEDLMPAEEDTL